MKQNYDVIIVGARIAGSTLAYELSKKGYDILLLERSTFPSDILSTHNFFNNSVGMLREMGVLDRLLATRTPTYKRAYIQFDQNIIDGSFPEVNGETDCLCIRRTYLDQILFEHASENEKVTAIEGFRVTDVVSKNGRIEGVIGIDKAGNTSSYMAKLVIGADGRNSTIRRLVNSERLTSVPTDFASYVAYLDHYPQKNKICTEFYKINDKLLISFPTSDNLCVMGIMFPLEDIEWRETFRSNSVLGFRSLINTEFSNTDLPARMQDARFVGPIRGLLGYDNDWYKGMGKGWALIGDAVSFKDPAVGQGMHDAIYESRILSEILNTHSSWDDNWEEMANTYQNLMESKMKTRFEMACQFTKNIPFSDQQHFINSMIASGSNLTQMFLGVYNYTFEPQDLENKIKELIARELKNE